MQGIFPLPRSMALGLALAMLTFLSACGHHPSTAPAATPPVATASQPAAPPAQAPASSASTPPTIPQQLTRSDRAWSSEALEDLVAPVALYPDVVLGQMLVAATNPQEVLDAGNWRLQNPALTGNALDEAAASAGFTPPVRGLLQSPDLIDMMCTHLAWTTDLGQAFTNDQQGVLDAVQRLRAQALAAGNLVSSDRLKVDTDYQDGHQVITISPPNPQVVYIPQYDPMGAYAPAADTSVSESENSGAEGATGVLYFGTGILV
ncbi:MAG TPA: DUF3300 domain-containing protein, partial [Steroidobacteraceae bacterium]|nr:DUF3300 domain-containing protein [Steroidobacteraceae bacterium]